MRKFNGHLQNSLSNIVLRRGLTETGSKDLEGQEDVLQELPGPAEVSWIPQTWLMDALAAVVSSYLSHSC